MYTIFSKSSKPHTCIVCRHSKPGRTFGSELTEQEVIEVGSLHIPTQLASHMKHQHVPSVSKSTPAQTQCLAAPVSRPKPTCRKHHQIRLDFAASDADMEERPSAIGGSAAQAMDAVHGVGASTLSNKKPLKQWGRCQRRTARRHMVEVPVAHREDVLTPNDGDGSCAGASTQSMRWGPVRKRTAGERSPLKEVTNAVRQRSKVSTALQCLPAGGHLDETPAQEKD